MENLDEQFYQRIQRLQGGFTKEEVEGFLLDRKRLDWLSNPTNIYHAEIQTQPSGEFLIKGNTISLRTAIDRAMENLK